MSVRYLFFHGNHPSNLQTNQPSEDSDLQTWRVPCGSADVGKKHKGCTNTTPILQLVIQPPIRKKKIKIDQTRLSTCDSQTGMEKAKYPLVNYIT